MGVMKMHDGSSVSLLLVVIVWPLRNTRHLDLELARLALLLGLADLSVGRTWQGTDGIIP